MIGSGKSKKQFCIVFMVFSLLLIPLIVFKVISLSESNDVYKKTFVSSGEIETIKEKIIVDSNIKSSDDIYYYNGSNVNNNLLFAGKCWLIVRTTDNNGVKLIYNGDPVNGVCGEAAYGTSSYTNYIGTDAVVYNSNANLLTSVGYMYGDYNYGKVNFYTDEQDVGFNGYFGTGSALSYYYGTSAIWNEDTETYTLENELKGGANMNMALSHKYTCGSTSEGASCEVVYVAEGGTSSASYVSLPPGKSYTALDYFKIISGFESASVMSQGSIEWLFSDGVYYNSSTKSFDLHHTGNSSTSSNVMTYDMSSWTSSTTAFNNYHYTCFTTEQTVSEVSLQSSFPSSTGFFASISSLYNISNSTKVNTPCSELYYIFYSGNSGLYYLKLDNSMSTSDINAILTALNSGTYLDETLLASNETSSNVKNIVDNWYDSYLANSSYEQYIIDDVYVNDRNLVSGGGWINKTDLTQNITFNTYNGITSGFSIEDKFTLSSGSIDSSNKALSSPIGLLSYDEAVLAGVTSTSPSYLGTRPFWLMSPHSYVEEASTTGASYDMVSYVYSINNGFTKSAVNSSNYVRPVISITADMPVAGTGTEEDPYSLVYSVEYTISGDGPSITLPETIYYKVGDTVLVDTNFSVGYQKDGYKFNGWSKSGSFSMTEENVVITGTWTKLSSFAPTITVSAITSSNVEIGGSALFNVSITNNESFAIENILIDVPNARCGYAVGITCTVVDSDTIKISSLPANTTYSTTIYVSVTEAGSVELEAEMTDAEATDAVLVSGTYKDSDTAYSKAGLEICNILTGTGNGSVNHYQILGYENNSNTFSYSLVLKDNECSKIQLNTDLEYTINQIEKQEYELDKIDGIVTTNGALFSLDSSTYDLTFYNVYSEKKYFHSWDREENDITLVLVEEDQ